MAQLWNIPDEAPEMETEVETRAMLVAKQQVGLPFDLSSDYSIR